MSLDPSSRDNVACLFINTTGFTGIAPGLSSTPALFFPAHWGGSDHQRVTPDHGPISQAVYLAIGEKRQDEERVFLPCVWQQLCCVV